MTKIRFSSDTHGFVPNLDYFQEHVDIDIFCGDMMNTGENPIDLTVFNTWFSQLSSNKKIFIFGNHDKLGESSLSLALSFINKDIVYLEDSSCISNDLKIYGSPVTPFFFNWAWNKTRGEQINKYWLNIPEDTNILITHGPPYSILDQAKPGVSENTGCIDLFNRIGSLKQLKIHAFGHIHGNHGHTEINNTKFVNASICTERYKPINRPIILEI